MTVQHQGNPLNRITRYGLVLVVRKGRHTVSCIFDGLADFGIDQGGKNVQEPQGRLDVEPFGVGKLVQSEDGFRQRNLVADGSLPAQTARPRTGGGERVVYGAGSIYNGRDVLERVDIPAFFFALDDSIGVDQPEVVFRVIFGGRDSPTRNNLIQGWKAAASLDRTCLSDEQWERVSPLLPGKIGDPGRSGADNRQFLEAILWMVRTGSPWRDLPDTYGNWNSIFQRFRR